MKMILCFKAFAFCFLFANMAMAQYNYASCPNGQSTSGSQVGYLNWRFLDPVTGAVSTSPLPDKVYTMNIFTSNAPASTFYNTVGIEGANSADGFRVYRSLNDANANNDNYYTQDQLAAPGGIAIDRSSVNFYIRTLPETDPNWSGQLTSFKAYGICTDGVKPYKYYRKTLVFRP